MRLILTMRQVPVVDLELRWPHKLPEGDDGPTLTAGAHLAGLEIAASMEPDTVAFGFGGAR